MISCPLKCSVLLSEYMDGSFNDVILNPEQVAESAAFVSSAIDGVEPAVGIITGSGISLSGFSGEKEITYSNVPYLPSPGVSGHDGIFVLSRVSEKTVLLARGRLHRYEGYSWDEIALPTRIFAALGCRYLIMTAAVGAVNIGLDIGTIGVITDHINLMGSNPFAGVFFRQPPELFVNPAGVYNEDLINPAMENGTKSGIKVRRVIYTALLGPVYETAAEVQMIQRLGGDVVGMSMVPEVLAAAECGIPVLGLVVVANRAGTPGSHAEVLDTVRAADEKLSEIIAGVIAGLC